MQRVKIVRGQIIWVDFGKPVGSEQGGIRPAIVIQNNVGNKYSPTLIVIPLTTSRNKAKLPTQVTLVINNIWQLAYGEQPKTIDRIRITEITNIIIQDMDMIDDALRVSMAL